MKTTELCPLVVELNFDSLKLWSKNEKYSFFHHLIYHFLLYSITNVIRIFCESIGFSSLCLQ